MVPRGDYYKLNERDWNGKLLIMLLIFIHNKLAGKFACDQKHRGIFNIFNRFDWQFVPSLGITTPSRRRSPSWIFKCPSVTLLWHVRGVYSWIGIGSTVAIMANDFNYFSFIRHSVAFLRFCFLDDWKFPEPLGNAAFCRARPADEEKWAIIPRWVERPPRYRKRLEQSFALEIFLY